MAYIGNTATTQAFTPAVDFFNGDNSTVAFTLSRPVASVAQVQAVVENVPQKPGDAYTVSGNTITFTSAPPSGTQNIYVYYTSPITQVIAPGQDTVATTQIQDSAVTTAKIANAAVTTAKLSSATGSGAVALASLPTFGTTIGVGGATASASGSGITFPASQSASTDANTLDDYEEGTWTPAWGASSGSMTYSSQVGRYVKIGRMVVATCHVVTNVNTSLSGNLYLTGLPFNADSSTNNYVACPMHVERVNLAANAWIWAHIGPNATTADVRYWANNGGAGYLNANTLLNSADIMVTCSYVTTQ